MSVVITNAYSARNAGDGLLVQLTQEVLSAAGLDGSPQTLIAADPGSFQAERLVPAPAALSMSFVPRARETLVALGRGRLGRIDDVLRGSALSVAVGGGYLRFGRPVEAVKSGAVHLSQLDSATRSSASTLLLPQSIGPLRHGRRRVLSVLSRADRVYVRDDRSMDDLSALPNVRRAPDLAVMSIARQGAPSRAAAGERVGVVLRALPAFAGYEERARRLLGRLGENAVPLVQSRVGSGNSDDAFYARLGRQAQARLLDALQENTVDAVVSVRMHGALQSILAGVPAVHLSYERKGFAAYEDLGLAPYVHSARTFDPEAVTAQLAALRQDASGFWRAVDARVPGLRAAYDQLVADVRELA